MNTDKIAELRNELDAIYLVMPQTFYQQRMRDKAAFEISKQLEKLENPIGYAELFWDNHEIRL